MQRCQDERTNLGELKAHILKKIGVERCKRYFYYLSRFLSQKLTKSEFDKSCFRVLGRENLSLHNQLIRSILRNATVSKSPPSVHLTKHVWSNGGVRKRKMRDSPVGSNGNVEHMLQQPLCMENGDLRGFKHQRSGRYYGADERDVAKSRIPCKKEVATAAVRDDENQERVASPLAAPLGIQFCSGSVGGGSFRTVPVVLSCYDSGGLPDTEMLRKRMENIAVAHGLQGVSMECANTLNAMLDVYLKKLLKSCTDLVGARSTNEGDPRKHSLDKHVLVTPDRRQDHHSVSLLDFRTAMELNPRQLGQDSRFRGVKENLRC